MVSTYLEVIDEGGTDVDDDDECATLDVEEDTELRRLVTVLDTLEVGGSEPLGVVVEGTAGDGVVWGGGVCEVVDPTGTRGQLVKGYSLGRIAGHTGDLTSDERTGHRVQRKEEEKKESGWPENGRRWCLDKREEKSTRLRVHAHAS